MFLTELSSGAALYVVEVVTVFFEVLRVGVDEGEAVAAGLKGRYAQVAGPVFVAREVVCVETIVVRAHELLCIWNKKGILKHIL